MKIKFGAIVVDGRGKIGGHVASKNRAGAYLRTKVTPVNPNTIAQSAARARLSSIAQSWRALTQSQRDSFNGAVANFTRTDIFGDIKKPSGSTLYQKLNNNLSLISQALISTAPAIGDVITTGFSFMEAKVTVPELTLYLDAAVDPSMTCVVYATPPLSPGISFVDSEYRVVSLILNGQGAAVDIIADYAFKFGNPVVDQKIFVKVKFVKNSTGQVSTFQSQSAIATLL